MNETGWVGAVVDALVDGLYVAGTTLLGYMVGQGGAPTMPSKPALMLAAITGLVGAANQLRALRKQPR